MRIFSTKEKALEWMVSCHLDEDYVDNERFAALGDPEAMEKYARAHREGCCGYDDALVYVTALGVAIVGCNFGH
jgi:hypothetical protein